MNYVLQKGPDGTTWVSLEPLMNDLKESVIVLTNMDLPQEEDDNRNMKLMGLKAAYEILGALVQEANLQEARDGKTLN